MSDLHDPVPHPGRGAATVLLAAASLGAAAIHLAAGPTHVQELGDIGLAFYWTAMFQIALGVGFIRAGTAGPGPVLARVALVGSLGITGVWAASRTVGLAFIGGGVESVGTADLVTTILQITTVVILLAIRRSPSAADRPASATAARIATPVSWTARAAVVAVVAVIALTSTIGVADATTGHTDGRGHASGAMDDHTSVPAEDHATGATDDDGHGELDAPDAHGHDEAPLP